MLHASDYDILPQTMALATYFTSLLAFDLILFALVIVAICLQNLANMLFCFFHQPFGG